jgi:hypothetical protein
MRQKSDAELLKVRVTGNEIEKELAHEELQHREARNVQIVKWTVAISVISRPEPRIE